MELDVQVFWHTDDTSQRQKIGIDYSVIDCERKVITLYDISVISPYVDEETGKEFSRIYVSGDTFYLY